MAFLTIALIFAPLLLVSYFFLSRRASPIPYFPSNRRDIPLIINALQLRNNLVVMDLGAGVGTVIMAAATAALKKNLNTQFIALEINPILLAILHLRRLVHPNKARMRIVAGDMFRFPFKTLLPTPGVFAVTAFYYISPWLLHQAHTHLVAELPRAHVVSYFYPLPHSKPTRIRRGIHQIFVYT